ncbi:MAG: PQQ-dependent dehydrogenase, methanol/ethanol family [Gammaproteobacteria bacterium]|nr:PQQ-dependent dehydrogenase, methanol/ethanol family [Gammaproteobacteria bacterium]
MQIRTGGNPRFWLSAVLSAGLLFTGLSAVAQQSTISRAPAFTTKDLLTPPVGNWVTNGGTLYNQRYSPLKQINRDNVSQLKGVWRTHLNGSGLQPKYSGEAQPIVYDGVIYVTTGADDVFAISVDSGEILWTYNANLPDEIPTLCCGWVNRGVAIGDGRVYLGRVDGKLEALDQRTGKRIWSILAEDPANGYSITSAPLYYDGMLITGFAGAEFGIRGRVKAYNAKTGKLIWTFYTIPGPGEPGHDTWPADNELWKFGGGSVWQTPAVDPELGLIYFSTGNPSPDFNGAVREGDNLYTDSMVALDIKTGKYRWHYQQVHHDIWDYDSTNPVILFDVPINGVMRKGIAEASKTGWIYILDRVTGKPLVGIEERVVPQEPRQKTAATQPHPVGDAFMSQQIDIPPEGYELINSGRIFTPFFGEDKGVITSPSLFGGANWPPSAYDPQRHYMFVCASEVIGDFKSTIADATPPAPGERYMGGPVGFTPAPRSGVIAAMDVTTNKAVWRYRWPDQCYSGAVATAGDLVFTGRSDGRLTALDSDTGRQLWEFQTGAGMNATVTPFEYKGKQYIVALSAGNSLVSSPHGDSVWLFALDGTLDQAQPRDSEPKIGTTAVATEATGEVDLNNGHDVYNQTCVACHGADGKGAHGGGAPLNKVTDADAVANVIRNGQKAMPPFGGILSANQVRDVSHYVVEMLFK